MKSWKYLLVKILGKFRLFFYFVLLYSFNVNSDNIKIDIVGNQNTDKEVIYSILEKLPDDLSIEYSNYLLNKINESKLFENVYVEIIDDKYVIYVTEYPSINNIYFRNNKRLKDDDLKSIANELDLNKISTIDIDKYIYEVTEIYKSLGFNSIEITPEYEVSKETNSSDLYFIFNEGEITKINKVYFIGNSYFDNASLYEVIKSKNKTLKNLFANNNYKLFQVKNDIIKIKNFYKNNGFIDIKASFEIEFLKKDKVNIFFNIIEGREYIFQDIKYQNFLKNNKKIIDESISDLIDSNKIINTNYSLSKIENIEKQISIIVQQNGINFFELDKLEKIEDNKVSLLFNIQPTKPKYLNQINISGNYRTYDYVIRRELEVSEGDPLNNQKLKKMKKKINSLNLFKSVDVNELTLNDETVDLNIKVEEKQTGSFNAGFSFGSLDGASFTTGLKEKNFGGTGRSIDFLINSSENNNTFELNSSVPHFYNYDFDFDYGLSYNQRDLSSSQSYKLDVYKLSSGLMYEFAEDFYHSINLTYESKDYLITNSETASTSVLNAQGKNVSFILQNKLTLNELNSLFQPTSGNYFDFSNTIETPTSSTNGYIKNEITFKKYLKQENNIYSIQSRLGNISSISGNEILSDNKFALGGRWLRGFDSYGAGPRNSRTSYIGGKNLFVTKLDYQFSLLQNDNPLYFNFFNDYGIVWDNKTKPNYSDESLRASYGIGLKFYSPIGPIGLSWGFPIMSKSYDIERMFLFSIGNIN